MPDQAELEVHPLTADRWDDLVDLFGPSGASSGCWCMFWRRRSRDMEGLWGAPARAALRELANAGPAPGLLAYRDGRPVGWCSIAPRGAYPRILHSPVAKPVDDQPAWSVVCFFIRVGERGRGVASALLDAAVGYAEAAGAEAVEGYPIDAERGRRQNAEMFVGSAAMFRAAGFAEIARRRPTRPIMRRELGGRAARGGRAGSR
jgi:GNAT superfamily N-acetyltransferase